MDKEQALDLGDEMDKAWDAYKEREFVGHEIMGVEEPPSRLGFGWEDEEL